MDQQICPVETPSRWNPPWPWGFQPQKVETPQHAISYQVGGFHWSTGPYSTPIKLSLGTQKAASRAPFVIIGFLRQSNCISLLLSRIFPWNSLKTHW